MALHREPHERVGHVAKLVRLHARGVLWPTEMWLSVAEALTPATAGSVLDSLPQEVQRQLHDAWLKGPPSAYKP